MYAQIPNMSSDSGSNIRSIVVSDNARHPLRRAGVVFNRAPHNLRGAHAAKCYHTDEMYKQRMALRVVIGRIVAVSGMGLAAAIAILAFVGGLWLVGLVATVTTTLFMGLMFLIERGAEHS